MLIESDKRARASVLEAMRDGQWHTLEDLAVRCGIKWPSTVASRIRDFAHRKGSVKAAPKDWVYETRAIEGRFREFEYRLEPVAHTPMKQMELPGSVSAQGD